MALEPTQFAILITTVVAAQNPAVHTMVKEFTHRADALDALDAINNYDDAGGVYYQTAVPLFKP